MMPVSLSILDAVYANMVHRVVYDFGGKAADLAEDTSLITGIDCSGFVRYILARATHGALVVPDGSSNMHAWAEANLRELVQYSDVQEAEGDPSRLFIAFIPPAPIGHVWLVRGGMTRESHGGRGVDSRPWNTPILLREAEGAYELVTTA